MNINFVPISVLTFGSYQNPLKTLFKKRRMPSVKRGLYGERINPKNVSLEHLKPASKGGRTELRNLALADKKSNCERGTKPLKEVLTWEMLEMYLSQFNFKIEGEFDGYLYQKIVKENCENLGIKNPNLKECKISKKVLRSMRNKAKQSNKKINIIV